MTDTDHPDYRAIEPPADTPPEEWHWRERRAELLDYITQAGGPENITQSRLADRYGVDQSTISRDIDRLGEYVGDTLGDDVHLSLYALRGRVVAELLAEDDWRATAKAWEIALEHADWCGVRPDDADVTDAGHLTDDDHVAGDIPDRKVTYELSEKDKQHLERLKAAAEATTASTRIDEHGDDIPAEEVRDRAWKQYDQQRGDDEGVAPDETTTAEN